MALRPGSMRWSTTRAARSSWRATGTSFRIVSSLEGSIGAGPRPVSTSSSSREPMTRGVSFHVAARSTEDRRLLIRVHSRCNRLRRYRLLGRDVMPRTMRRPSHRRSHRISHRPADRWKFPEIHGSVFRFRPVAVPSLGMTDHWMLTWEAGPDAGGSTTLGHGTHIIGRAAGAAMRCDDLALEPHHLQLEISNAGAVLRQLTGRVPARVDGEPLGESLIVESVARVEVGCSVLQLARGDLTRAGQTPVPANITLTATGSVVMRRPRAAPEWNPEPIPVPPPQVERSQASGGV